MSLFHKDPSTTTYIASQDIRSYIMMDVAAYSPLPVTSAVVFQELPTSTITAPNITTVSAPRPSVIRSLERSLEDNATVWEQLSKY